MSQSQRIDLAGIPMQLLPGRGVWIEGCQTLLVADTHFGKEATFRRHHIPVPAGTSEGTLSAISRMIDQTSACRLVILGDMFHARSSLSRDVCSSIESFLKLQNGVEIILVRGNHDRHVGPLPPHWPIEVVDQYRIDRVLLTHHPSPAPAGSDLVLCGHLHPSIRIETMLDNSGVLPCFWYSDRQLVLPAIGEFTGTHRVKPKPDDRVWLVVDDQVIEYSRRANSAALRASANSALKK